MGPDTDEKKKTQASTVGRARLALLRVGGTSLELLGQVACGKGTCVMEKE